MIGILYGQITHVMWTAWIPQAVSQLYTTSSCRLKYKPIRDFVQLTLQLDHLEQEGQWGLLPSQLLQPASYTNMDYEVADGSKCSTQCFSSRLIYNCLIKRMELGIQNCMCDKTAEVVGLFLENSPKEIDEQQRMQRQTHGDYYWVSWFPGQSQWIVFQMHVLQLCRQIFSWKVNIWCLSPSRTFAGKYRSTQKWVIGVPFNVLAWSLKPMTL